MWHTAIWMLINCSNFLGHVHENMLPGVLYVSGDTQFSDISTIYSSFPSTTFHFTSLYYSSMTSTIISEHLWASLGTRLSSPLPFVIPLFFLSLSNISVEQTPRWTLPMTPVSIFILTYLFMLIFISYAGLSCHKFKLVNVWNLNTCQLPLIRHEQLSWPCWSLTWITWTVTSTHFLPSSHNCMILAVSWEVSWNKGFKHRHAQLVI